VAIVGAFERSSAWPAIAMRALFWNTAELCVLRTPLRRTLLTAPHADADETAFKRLVHMVDDAGGKEVGYDAAEPKHVFFRYLLGQRPVLLHGTADRAIDCFEPRRQTDYDNEWTNAVFATDDRFGRSSSRPSTGRSLAL
jgi:hypothetical protein